MSGFRTAPCPCGSGRKHKHCCLEAERTAAQLARLDDAVGARIQQWSTETLADEIATALEEFAGPDRQLSEDEVGIFADWFHNDRELAGGDTPAERYAARPGLAPDERAIARRIASAPRGPHRVLAVEPGRWIELEDIVAGDRVRVRSANVSADAVRWDILLGRVMDGDPPTLWGPTRFFEPAAEPSLMAELERLTRKSCGGADPDDLAGAMRQCSLELMRFRPPGAGAKPAVFTLEGDPLVRARASWSTLDRDAVRARMSELGGVPADELERGERIEITAPREALIANRPELPPGALIVESGPVGEHDSVPVAATWIEGDELLLEAMSEERLDRAIEIVEGDFGDLLERAEREVSPIESESESVRPHGPPSGLTAAEERTILAGHLSEHYRRWLDEPIPALGGHTPRRAVGDGRRADVVRLLREIENRSERAGRRGAAVADISWIGRELGLDDELAA